MRSILFGTNEEQVLPLGYIVNEVFLQLIFVKKQNNYGEVYKFSKKNSFYLRNIFFHGVHGVPNNK